MGSFRLPRDQSTNRNFPTFEALPVQIILILQGNYFFTSLNKNRSSLKIFFPKNTGWMLMLLFMVSTSVRAFAGNKPETTGLKANVASLSKNKRFFVLAEYKNLHSTHRDNFMGKDIILTYRVTRSLFLGLGAEYTNSKFHDDNGWRLYNIRFIPIFADAKWFLPGSKIFAPFLQLSEGISFNHYNRMDSPYISSYFVSETGDYLYTGVGCVLKLNDYLKPVIGIGFNGFKMSFDSWDVNPHGFAFRIGLLF